MRILPLLEELVQTQSSEKKYNGILGRPNNNPNNTHKDLIGWGAFSKVKADKTDPHMVVKSPLKPSNEDRDDGFDLYVDYIIKNKLQDNIHFPRVYVNKRISDKDGRYIHKYQMERLIPYDDLTLKEIGSVVEHNFHADDDVAAQLASADKDADRTEDEEPYDEVDHDFHDPVYHVATWMSAMLSRALYDGNFQDIKLRSLGKALQEIRKLVESNKYLYLDMHEGNFMFRRTPHGLQLVISDPVGAKVKKRMGA